jgi:hypothetical protein
MQMNTTLTALELNGNNIDYDGATALAEAITQNTSLSVLHLRCERVSCLHLPAHARAELALKLSQAFLTILWPRGWGPCMAGPRCRQQTPCLLPMIKRCKLHLEKHLCVLR